VNAQVADGTGGPLKSANVRINGDRIVKVGQFTPRQDEYVIDAKGLVLAPGFIDIHSPRPAAFGGDRQRHGQPRIADSASGCHAQQAPVIGRKQMTVTAPGRRQGVAPSRRGAENREY
jgi:imidazolonepropionase-like amidohydrolase